MAEQTAMHQAVRRTLAYMDVFAYPLTDNELHRFLEGIPAEPAAVQTAVAHLLAESRPRIARTGRYLHLPGRERIIGRRTEREQVAAQLWPRARAYGRLISHLPFVRMVAVTGSLAMNNTAAGADIDFLIVTANDRLWLCRAAVIALVRLAARRGVLLCPNYFISERALRFQEQNLYTAHELVQMVPLAGQQVYYRLRRLNRWTAAYLPNAADEIPAVVNGSSPWQPMWELPLRTPPARWLERWEMGRKIEKYSSAAAEKVETHFTADRCKGHFTPHGRHTLRAYRQRLNGHNHG